MKPSAIADAVTSVFKGGVTPSEPTNTPVVLASQAEPAPQPRPDHGEKDGDGKMPEFAAGRDDRARVLKEIAERRNAQAVEESQERMPATDEDGNETETAAAPPEAEGADLDAGSQEPTPDASALPAVAAQPAPAAPAPEEMRTIIVNGQSVEVPLSRIVDMGTRTMQKEVAADERLKQATEILEEARRIAAPPAKPPEPSLADKTDEELADLIQYGSKEDAAKAIKALRSSAPVLKPEEIVRAAQAAVAPAMAFEQGKIFAQKEYGDLLADPDYRTIFLNKENALRQSGDRRSYEELYRAIGDEMRVKFNKPKAGAPLPQAQPSTQGRTMAEKQAAKAQAPAAPRLASQRLDGEGTQPRPPTRAEIIDKQRRARGYQPYAAQK